MKNPLTIEAFCEWLGKQPAEEPYDHNSVDNCAIGQFMKANVPEMMSPGNRYWHDRDGQSHLYPAGFTKIGINEYRGPFTFGAAHKRALAYLEGQK